MSIRPDHNDLDLGCGIGWAIRVLAQGACRGIVVEADLSDRMILEARSMYRNPTSVLFLVADAGQIPCRLNSSMRC